MNRAALATARRWILKIGSSLLTADGQGLDHTALGRWVAEIAALRQRGVEVVIVSSGAVAEGMARLGWNRRPNALNELQAAAAVGQMGLIQAWESHFQRHGLHTAQVLLTHDDLSSRARYLNARSTLRTLIELGVIPIINENDTVAMDEIRLGDNDTLAALVANLVEADVMVILTDQSGLYDRDPRTDPQARLITEAAADDDTLAAMAGDSGSGLGRGGMRTKLSAARLAARSGTATLIASGREAQVLSRLHGGEAALGTLLTARQGKLLARKQWLAGQLQAQGTITLDDGAVRVLREAGKSLLAVGVRAVSGEFERGALVRCLDGQGQEIARGLINYSSNETARLLGQPTQRIEEILGYVDEPELIHRDNLVVV